MLIYEIPDHIYVAYCYMYNIHVHMCTYTHLKHCSLLINIPEKKFMQSKNQKHIASLWIGNVLLPQDSSSVQDQTPQGDVATLDWQAEMQ